MRLAPWDELEVIQEQTEEILTNPTLSVAERRQHVCDLFLDILILSYVYGTQDAADMLGIELEPDAEAMQNSIYHRIDGITFVDRVADHIPEEGLPSLGGLMNLVESEMTWNYNQGGLWAARIAEDRNGMVMKHWNTMMDERVRDSHVFLEGVQVALGEMFYTLDGDSALAPGGFGTAENNVGCRCWLTYSYAM